MLRGRLPGAQPYHSFMMGSSELTPTEILSVHDLHQRFPGGTSASGHLGPHDLPRLASDGIELPKGLEWSATLSGERLSVSGRGEMSRACRRCLGPVLSPFSFTRIFELCESAAEADARIDLESEELESLATEDGASVASLIEDELLLGNADFKGHETCSPHPALIDAQTAAKRPSDERQRPFEGLARMLSQPKD